MERHGCQSDVQQQNIPSLIEDLCRSIRDSSSNSLRGRRVNLKGLKNRAFALLLGQAWGLHGSDVAGGSAAAQKLRANEDVLQAKMLETSLWGRKEAYARLKQCLTKLSTSGSKGVQSCVQFLVLLSNGPQENMVDATFPYKLFDLHQNLHSQRDSTWYMEYSKEMFEGLERMSDQCFSDPLNVFEAVPGFDTNGNQLFAFFGSEDTGGGHEASWTIPDLTLPPVTPLTRIARNQLRSRRAKTRPSKTIKALPSSAEKILWKDVLPDCPSPYVENKVLLQHVLYLLAGVPSKSFIWDRVRFIPRRGLCIRGLSERALLNALKDFLQCGTDVHYMVEWSKDLGRQRGLVMSSFCVGLRRYLHSYHGVLLCLTHNREKMTLLRMNNLTARIREQIRSVASLCRQVLHFDSKGKEVRGSELLSQLYSSAATGWCRSHYTLMLQLLHYAAEPYCRFLQSLLFHGHYSDPFREFPICMDNRLTSGHDENFWSKNFVLAPSRELPFLSHLSKEVPLCAKTVALLWLCQPQKMTLWRSDSAPTVTLTFSRELLQSIKEMSENYVKKNCNQVVHLNSTANATNNQAAGEPSSETTAKAERSLNAGLQNILVSDSSNEQLESIADKASVYRRHLGTFAHAQQNDKVHSDPSPKYENVEYSINEKEGNQQSTQAINELHIEALPPVGALVEPSTSWETYLMPDYCIDLPSSGEELLALDEAIEAAPLADLVEQSLLPPLEAQIHLVNRAAVDYFVNELELPSHLRMLGDFFCLQDGDFAQTLCSGICEKMTASHTPSDLLNRCTLSSILSDAVASSPRRDSPHIGLLTMDARNIPESFSSGDNVLSCILLSYQVQWPLNLVITGNSLQRYNKVFHFLLQIRRAQWALSDISFRLRPTATKESSYNYPQLKKLHTIRHEMQIFAQLLVYHVSSQAVETTLWELQDTLCNKVRTLDDIRQAHATCISRLGRRCLLAKRAAPIARVLHRVLRCIWQFHTCVMGQPWIPRAQDTFEQVLRTHNNFRNEIALLCQALKYWGTSASLPWCTRLSSALSFGDTSVTATEQGKA